MKKLFLIAALFCLTLNIHAQDVFNELLSSSLKVAEDTKKDIETRKIATFKYDELCYMKQKLLPEVLKDTTNMVVFNRVIDTLNQQSYAMYKFVNLFVEKLSKSKKKNKQEAVVAIFKGASINNPLFHDEDTSLVHAYYNNENYLTQFSLDTDWIKALEEVQKRDL